MRIFFAGGGTGGHLYPGLAIARALTRLSSDVHPFFIGARRGIDRDVLPRANVEYELLDLHPLYRDHPWQNWKTMRGALSAFSRLEALGRAEHPALIVGTGGYASGLALGYGALQRIPLVIQEQNTYPGITTRFFSRFAAQVHLGFPEARSRLSPGRKTIVRDSGNPIEPPPPDAADKLKGRAHWDFPASGGKVLLIYGGSQGSQAINGAVAEWILGGLPPNLYVIWATGTGNYQQFAALESDRVRIRAYLDPVSDAYRAADLTLSRAGAMATAELCAWGIPMVLVPLPTAAADHQSANARALESAGAARVIVQPQLSAGRLREISSLIHDPEALSTMAAMCLVRARPDAAEEIAISILGAANLK